jgi:hypothetical protein
MGVFMVNGFNRLWGLAYASISPSSLVDEALSAQYGSRNPHTRKRGDDMKPKRSPVAFIGVIVLTGILGNSMALARPHTYNVQLGFVAGGPAYSPSSSYSTHDYYLSPNGPPPVIVPSPQTMAEAKKGNSWFCADGKADYLSAKECAGLQTRSR